VGTVAKHALLAMSAVDPIAEIDVKAVGANKCNAVFTRISELLGLLKLTNDLISIFPGDLPEEVSANNAWLYSIHSGFPFYARFAAREPDFSYVVAPAVR
jgi:hypothetical protein